MGRAVMLRGKTQQERDQHETDGPLFVRGENKNLAPRSFGTGPFHLGRGLTCRDQYFVATSSKLAASVLGEHRRMDFS